MSPRVAVEAAVYRWACERNRTTADDWAARFPRLPDWISGEARPTLKQLEAFADATHTSIGFFFLPEPPVETIPIRDFRTIAGKPAARPSPDLLDTIYVCQQRQDWYQEFARTSGEDALPFVGAARLGDDVTHVAAEIRGRLRFDVPARGAMPTWADALRVFIANADDAGIMVMCSGVVGSNNRRRLDPREFRGFALVDPLAPLVFVNGADSKSAQMFTLAHELAHVWLGETGVSDADPTRAPAHQIERWCDAVAAELLVPIETFRAQYQRRADLAAELPRLARIFKVSTLVVLRRMHDAGGLGRERFWREYEKELQRLLALPKGGGGNYYLTTAARVSKRFARALVVSTAEGRASFTEAMRLLGMRNTQTFDGLAESLGMAV